MTFTLKINYYEYVNDVLLKEIILKEHRLNFKNFEDAKTYAVNQAYNCFDVAYYEVQIESSENRVYMDNKYFNFFNSNLEQTVGESYYKCVLSMKGED